MTYMEFIIKSVIRTIQRHKLLMLLMIILITCSFSILGLVLDQGNKLKESAADYSETYGKTTYYFTADGMTDQQYYEYLDDEDTEIYRKIEAFKNLLLAEKRILFISLVEQPVEIYGTDIPDIFLDGYEEGQGDFGIFQMDGEDWYRTKSLQVSDSFFEFFQIQAASGRGFEPQDYTYQEGKQIPVMLGDEYAGTFQLGDIITCNYLSADVSLEVVGFLEGDTFFYDEMNKEFKSCGRYIVLPAFSSNETEYFDKIRLLTQVGGMIISNLGYLEVKKIFDEIQQEAGVNELHIYMEDPAAASETVDLLETYSAMTEEVLKQFKIILGILFIFVAISITTIMCGFIREKNYEYGIQLLCGARPIQVFGDIFLLCFGTLLAGSITTIYILTGCECSLKSISIVLMVALILGGIIIANLFFFLYKMDISEIIGGRE